MACAKVKSKFTHKIIQQTNSSNGVVWQCPQCTSMVKGVLNNKDFFEDTIKEMQSRLDTLKAEYARVETENKEKGDRVLTLEQQNQATTNEIDHLNEQITATELELANLELEYKAAWDHIIDQSDESTARAEQVQDMQMKVKKAIKKTEKICS